MRQNAWIFMSSFFQTQDMLPLMTNSCKVIAGNSGSWKEGGGLGLSHTLTGMNLPGHGAKPRPRLERALFLFLKCFTSLPALFSFIRQSYVLIVFQSRYCGCSGRSRRLALQVNNNKSQLCFQFNCWSPCPVTLLIANSLHLENNGGDVALRFRVMWQDCSHVSWTLLVAFSMAYADIQYQPHLCSSPSKNNQSSNYGVQME